MLLYVLTKYAMNFGAKSPQKLNELTDVLESLPNASNRKTSIIASILNWARDNSIHPPL